MAFPGPKWTVLPQMGPGMAVVIADATMKLSSDEGLVNLMHAGSVDILKVSHLAVNYTSNLEYEESGMFQFPFGI